VKNCEEQNQWPDQFKPSQRTELIKLAHNMEALSKELETFANSTVIELINETQAFVQQVINTGYGHLVETGDLLVLPQEDEHNCCWHSVFNLGEESGQALSFAIRGQ